MKYGPNIPLKKQKKREKYLIVNIVKTNATCIKKTELKL